MMRLIFLIVLLAGCDSNAVLEQGASGPQSVTYRITSKSKTLLPFGVSWEVNAEGDRYRTNTNVDLPFEVTIPFYEGRKHMLSQIIGGDVTFWVLVDDEVVAESYFPPTPDTSLSSLSGIVAGEEEYLLHYFFNSHDPTAEFVFKINGEDRLGDLGTRDQHGRFIARGTMLVDQLPANVTIGKVQGTGIVTLSSFRDNSVSQLFDYIGNRDYRMTFDLK